MNCSAPLNDDTHANDFDAGKAQRHRSRSCVPLVFTLLAIATIVAALCLGGGA